MSFANDRGLLLEVNKGASEALNREEAAMMIYNALLSTMQVKQAIAGHDQPGYNDVHNTEAQDYRSEAAFRDSDQQLIEKYFPSVTEVTDEWADDFGRPATVWKNGKEKITDETVEEPEFVYTDREVSEITRQGAGDTIVSDEIASDLKGYVSQGALVRVNGVPNGTIRENDSDDLAIAIAELTGNGRLVEVYTNEKGTEVTRVIIANYTVDVVKNVNSRNGNISLTLNNQEDITPKADYYDAIATAGSDDIVLVAVGRNNNGEGRLPVVIDAYIPEAVNNAAVTEISSETKFERRDSTVTVGGNVFTIWNNGVRDWSADATIGGIDLVVNSDDTGTAFLDQYGYLAAYKRANNDASDWGLLMSIYRKTSDNEVGEASTDYNAVIVTEDGSIEYMPLLYKTEGDYARAAADTVSFVNSFTAEPTDANRIPGVVQMSANNWFRQEGILVAYKETGAGYKLLRHDFRDDEGNPQKSMGVEDNNFYDKDWNNIDSIYLSDDLSVNTVSGEKASDIKVKNSAKITKDLGEGTTSQYKYVWKKIGNNILVTAVFLVNGAAEETVLKVSKIVSPEATYGDANLVGTKIEYYTANSTDLKTVTVSDESDGGRDIIEGAFYFTTSEIKDGVTINWASASKKAISATVSALDGSEAYGSSFVVNGGDRYIIAENATVIDLDECGIDTPEELVDQIAKTGANANTDTIRFSFTYTLDGTDKVVKQIYVDSVTPPAL
jgi:hypothetical protein